MAGTNEWPVYLSAEAVATQTAEDPEGAWKLVTVPDDEPDLLGQPVHADAWANQIWSKRTRYLGVGAMVVGGLWALIRLWGSLVAGVRAGFHAYRGGDDDADVARTDRDTPMNAVLVLIVLTIGGKLFGVWGLVLGLPVVNYVFGHAIRRRPGEATQTRAAA